MRVLLVNPSQFRAYGVRMATPYPPLGLLYIGAVWQRCGFEVAFLDMDIEGEDGLRRCLSAAPPDVVGVTATTPVFSDAQKVAAFVREHAPDAIRVIGGPHATADTADALQDGYFHVAVVGEGEATAAALAEHWQAGRRDHVGIRGTAVADDSGLRVQPRRAVIADLDGLPFPDRRLLPGLGAYSPPDAVRGPVATIMASRGCPGRCTFCCSPGTFGGQVRYRSVSDVVDEIGHVVREYGAREIHFADDSLTENREWTLELCDALRRVRYPVRYMFMNGLRVNRVDAEVLQALRDMGMENVGFGIESGSPKILERLRKGIDLDQAHAAIQMAKEIGFSTWVFLIIGSPGETDETARETIDFAKRSDPDFAKFFVFKPFPGTRAYRDLAAGGHLVNYDRDRLGIYTSPVHEMEGMTSERMMYWLRQANREFYLRPKKVFDHVRRVKSATQLRYNLRSLRFVVNVMLRTA